MITGDQVNTAIAVAKELGIHFSTLHVWVAKYYPKNKHRIDSSRNENKSSANLTEKL